DDYPPFCTDVGEAVVADAGSLGVVIGGSGNGEQIAANKVAGVRAALVWNEDTARLARQHNDANVISVGARQHSEDALEALIDLFLAEPFTGEERHQRRIDLVGLYERTGGYEASAAPTADWCPRGIPSTAWRPPSSGPSAGSGCAPRARRGGSPRRSTWTGTCCWARRRSASTCSCPSRPRRTSTPPPRWCGTCTCAWACTGPGPS